MPPFSGSQAPWLSATGVRPHPAPTHRACPRHATSCRSIIVSASVVRRCGWPSNTKAPHTATRFHAIARFWQAGRQTRVRSPIASIRLLASRPCISGHVRREYPPMPISAWRSTRAEIPRSLDPLPRPNPQTLIHLRDPRRPPRERRFATGGSYPDNMRSASTSAAPTLNAKHRPSSAGRREGTRSAQAVRMSSTVWRSAR